LLALPRSSFLQLRKLFQVRGVGRVHENWVAVLRLLGRAYQRLLRTGTDSHCTKQKHTLKSNRRSPLVCIMYSGFHF
jgi:hypothetical protein